MYGIVKTTHWTLDYVFWRVPAVAVTMMFRAGAELEKLALPGLDEEGKPRKKRKRSGGFVNLATLGIPVEYRTNRDRRGEK